MIIVPHTANRATRIATINPSIPPTVLHADPLLSALRSLKFSLLSVARISDGVLLLVNIFNWSNTSALTCFNSCSVKLFTPIISR